MSIDIIGRIYYVPMYGEKDARTILQNEWYSIFPLNSKGSKANTIKLFGFDDDDKGPKMFLDGTINIENKEINKIINWIKNFNSQLVIKDGVFKISSNEKISTITISNRIITSAE